MWSPGWIARRGSGQRSSRRPPAAEDVTAARVADRPGHNHRIAFTSVRPGHHDAQLSPLRLSRPRSAAHRWLKLSPAAKKLAAMRGGPDGSVGHRTRRAATNGLRGPAAAGAAAAVVANEPVHRPDRPVPPDGRLAAGPAGGAGAGARGGIEPGGSLSAITPRQLTSS